MAVIDRAAVQTPAIFGLIQREGNIPERDMFNTFNMGVGLCMMADAADTDRILAILKEQGEDARVIGRVAAGEKGVEIR